MRSQQVGKESVGCLETIPNKRVDTGGRIGEERELERAQFLLLEQGIEKERFTESGSDVTGAERVHAVLRTIESIGGNRDQL